MVLATLIYSPSHQESLTRTTNRKWKQRCRRALEATPLPPRSKLFALRARCQGECYAGLRRHKSPNKSRGRPDPQRSGAVGAAGRAQQKARPDRNKQAVSLLIYTHWTWQQRLGAPWFSLRGTDWKQRRGVGTVFGVHSYCPGAGDGSTDSRDDQSCFLEIQQVTDMGFGCFERKIRFVLGFLAGKAETT